MPLACVSWGQTPHTPRFPFPDHEAVTIPVARVASKMKRGSTDKPRSRPALAGSVGP